MNKDERNRIVDWCALLSGISPQYFEKMDDDQLLKEHSKVLEEASLKMEKFD